MHVVPCSAVLAAGAAYYCTCADYELVLSVAAPVELTLVGHRGLLQTAASKEQNDAQAR